MAIQLKEFPKRNRHLEVRTFPTREPTINEIYWAAGIYEGEGCVGAYSTKRKTPACSLIVSVAQKDEECWILNKFVAWWGGGLSEQNGCQRWQLGGQRGVDFLCAIAPLLSPRRLQQARTMIGRYNLKDATYVYSD